MAKRKSEAVTRVSPVTTTPATRSGSSASVDQNAEVVGAMSDEDLAEDSGKFQGPKRQDFQEGKSCEEDPNSGQVRTAKFREVHAVNCGQMGRAQRRKTPSNARVGVVETMSIQDSQVSGKAEEENSVKFHQEAKTGGEDEAKSGELLQAVYYGQMQSVQRRKIRHIHKASSGKDEAAASAKPNSSKVQCASVIENTMPEESVGGVDLEPIEGLINLGQEDILPLQAPVQGLDADGAENAVFSEEEDQEDEDDDDGGAENGVFSEEEDDDMDDDDGGAENGVFSEEEDDEDDDPDPPSVVRVYVLPVGAADEVWRNHQLGEFRKDEFNGVGQFNNAVLHMLRTRDGGVANPNFRYIVEREDDWQALADVTVMNWDWATFCFIVDGVIEFESED